MDVENLAMMEHMLEGPKWTDADYALDAIHEIGTSGHHFGTAHTQERYQTAFYPNFLHDRRNNGTWLEGGGEDTAQRAHKIWKQVLKNYEKPAIDSNMEQALREYVERRSKELENEYLYD